ERIACRCPQANSGSIGGETTGSAARYARAISASRRIPAEAPTSSTIVSRTLLVSRSALGPRRALTFRAVPGGLATPSPATSSVSVSRIAAVKSASSLADIVSVPVEDVCQRGDRPRHGHARRVRARLGERDGDLRVREPELETQENRFALL